MQQSFLSSYSHLNHLEKRLSKQELLKAEKENKHSKVHKKHTSKKGATKNSSVEGIKLH